jgi:glycerol-3-phosphate acyltransferase PlsY
VFASLAATLVVVRHIPNIRRLARGEEPRLSSRLLGGS